MTKQYHILNGDSLKEQFPSNIEGDIIVARECLVDGNVEGNTLSDFFNTRAKFLSNAYGGSEQDYFDSVVPEFKKMQNIESEAAINLWFEDDLFCQVNLWFVLNLLSRANQKNPLFLVRPKVHTQYGFAGLDQSELTAIYENKLLLTELGKLASLWHFYQTDDQEGLLETAKQIKASYPFILAAVQAHIERVPTNGNIGRPSQSIIQIMDELNTDKFGPVFREFCKREAIYGFGDLQVKTLFDEVKKS